MTVIFKGLVNDSKYTKSDRKIVNLYVGQYGTIIGKGKLGHIIKFTDNSTFILKEEEIERVVI